MSEKELDKLMEIPHCYEVDEFISYLEESIERFKIDLKCDKPDKDIDVNLILALRILEECYTEFKEIYYFTRMGFDTIVTSVYYDKYEKRIFEIICNPNIHDNQKTAKELMKKTGIKQSTMYTHLNHLEGFQLIEKQGKAKSYIATIKGLRVYSKIKQLNAVDKLFEESHRKY